MAAAAAASAGCERSLCRERSLFTGGIVSEKGGYSWEGGSVTPGEWGVLLGKETALRRVSFLLGSRPRSQLHCSADVCRLLRDLLGGCAHRAQAGHD